MRYVRPEYIFRPTQIVRRVAYSLGIGSRDHTRVLPWGHPIAFDPNELHGRAVLTLGLSDIRTTELISQIVRTGDTTIDIGANIGLMTSIMAKRSGPTGFVYAFEPHPRTRALLASNAQLWAEQAHRSATVQVLPYAVSTRQGISVLNVPEMWIENSGIASLETSAFGESDSISSVDVETVSFDEWARDLDTVRLVKIDVEGHEDSVISGARVSLSNKKIDYLIIEEMRSLPSPATLLLKQLGYRCFLIDRNLWGLVLKPVELSPARLVGEATNILAVSDAVAIDDILSRGWSCLR